MRQNSPQSLTQERLKQLLHYDPETGVFTWRVRRGFKANVGSVAGAMNARGYVLIWVEMKSYPAHRLAFLYMTGSFPLDQVDHINGRRTDNRWCNLRTLGQPENSHNIAEPRSNGSSGFLGAHFRKDCGCWAAAITSQGAKKHLGLFPTPEQAHAAYLKAKDETHPTHRRLRTAA